MPNRTCDVADCSRVPRSPNATLCNTHYFRVRRTGNAGSAHIWDKKPGHCSAPDCTGRIHGQGLCAKHWHRQQKYGDITFITDTTADRSGRWIGDTVSYHGMHDRVRAAKGSASQHRCTHCAKQARHWAYGHTDLDEKTSTRGAYSVDPGHYIPLCVSCHKVLDLRIIAASRH